MYLVKIEIIIHVYNLKLKNVFGIKILLNVWIMIKNVRKIHVNIVNIIVNLLINYGMVITVMNIHRIYQIHFIDVIN